MCRENIHKGLGGQSSYSQFNAVPCDCSDGTGYHPYCSAFDFLTGLILFDTTGISSSLSSSLSSAANAQILTQYQFERIMTMFVKSKGPHHLDKAIHFVAYAGITFGNGKIDALNTSALSVQDLIALRDITNKTRHKDAYYFCNDECSVLVVNYNDPYSNTINNAFLTLENGSCTNSFFMSDNVWSYFIDANNAPVSLIEVYYKCIPYWSNAILSAFGETGGLTGVLIILISVIITSSAIIFGVKQTKYIPEYYDNITKEKVLEELANYLLFVRDGRGGREEEEHMIQAIIKTLQQKSNKKEKAYGINSSSEDNDNV